MTPAKTRRKKQSARPAVHAQISRPAPGSARGAAPRPQRSPHARYTPADELGIGRLELTRPDKLNATDDDSVQDLDRAATLAARDRRARAILVSGRGRAFCSGIDLAALAGDDLGADWFRRWDVALARIESIPVATVAAIQGPCLGGGLQIALCCDLQVASEDATFGLSAVRHGIVPGLATYRLPRQIGMGPARELMLLGETWDAKRALRHGLVSRVVAAARLEETALELARKLAGNVRTATAATKRLTLRSYDLPLQRFLAEYVRAQRTCWDDRETRANLARYRTGRWGKRNDPKRKEHDG